MFRDFIDVSREFTEKHDITGIRLESLGGLNNISKVQKNNGCGKSRKGNVKVTVWLSPSGCKTKFANCV